MQTESSKTALNRNNTLSPYRTMFIYYFYGCRLLLLMALPFLPVFIGDEFRIKKTHQILNSKPPAYRMKFMEWRN